ncbi:MAG: metallophosphoesterase [Chromatiaceae bacterium]|nr:metallophosphoesterase [Candidatus Thioaporhodococcus sediminis]
MRRPARPPCLKIILTLLLLCLPVLTARAASDHFFFVQITDSHFGANDNLERGRRVVELINQLPMPVEFVVHTGDILADLILDPKVVDQTLEVMANLQPPLFYIPGNHDIHQKDSDQALAVYRERFGPLVQVEEIGGVVAIFLYIEPAARDWPVIPGYDPLAELEKALVQAGDRPVLLFQHTPPVGGFFRNMLHRGWPEDKRQRWEALVSRHQVKGVFTGHYHKDELHWLGNTPIFVAPPISGSWGRQTSFRVYEYRDGVISYRSLYLQ